MNKTNPLKRFFNIYLKKNKISISLSIILSLLSGLAIAIGPKQLGNVTTAIIDGLIQKVYGLGNIDFLFVNKKLLIVLIIYIIGMILSMLQGKIIANIMQYAIKTLRDDISEKINKLPIRFFDNKEKKKVVLIVDKDIETVFEYSTLVINEALTCISVAVMVVALMFYINVALAIATIITVPIFGIIIKVSSKEIKQKIQVAYAKNDDLSGYTEEILENQKLIKTMSAQKNLLNKFERKNKILKNNNEKAQFTSSFFGPIVALAGNLNYLLIGLLGADLAIRGVISIGDIQTFVYYNRLLSKPLYMIGVISNIILSIVESLERIFEFLDTEEEKEEKAISIDNIDGRIDIQNLNFSYLKEKEVLKNININIEKGQKIAIVGKTGAGKSTIIKILMKFYRNYKGKVLIDGNEIQKIDTAFLRENIGIVLQNNWLFKGTIKENIMYGKKDATNEEIIEAAKIAQVHDFIETLPKKYDTILEEGSSNISMGEKQLICIARMIIKNPKIILLDEATNLLDIETEKRVQQAIEQISNNKTCVVVAHRLSTIMNSDNIIVVDDGKIVEEGNHDQLMKKKGKYFEMYQYFAE